MSIAFAENESKSTLEALREARLRADGGVRRDTSAARVEANRRNARKSTGPRTVEGKRRASRNALKHGLCRTLACLPSECEATFFTFVGELEAELRPATPLQRITFNQIAGLTWRLERLPEAQARIFEQELAKVDPDEHDEPPADGTVRLKASDVLARRFSDDPGGNGFALLERYERGMRSQLLRLMKHYDQLQKRRPSVPYDKGEPPCPDEGKKPAWTQEKARAQRERSAEQARRLGAGEPVDPDRLRTHEVARQQREEAARAERVGDRPESSTVEAAASLRLAASQIDTPSSGTPQTEESRPGAAPTSDGAKRNQSKPTGNLDSARPARKCAVAERAAVTKRSQGDWRAGEVFDKASAEASDEASGGESNETPEACRGDACAGSSGTLRGPI